MINISHAGFSLSQNKGVGIKSYIINISHADFSSNAMNPRPLQTAWMTTLNKSSKEVWYENIALTQTFSAHSNSLTTLFTGT